MFKTYLRKKIETRKIIKSIKEEKESVEWV